MASLQQLQDETMSWLNRRDCLSLLPGWITMVETQISQTCRTRAQVTSAVQAIDASYIALPSDFATMESIRDYTTGEMLELKDEWSGHWTGYYNAPRVSPYAQINPNSPCSAYRLVANCIEFLPHPLIPDPPDPNWVPQQVLMGWYQKPRPLVLPTDTNAVLENHYAIYLFALCKMGAVWAMDDDRAAQMDAQWQQVVTQANLWKQQSDYSGAPLKSELATVF